MMCISNNQHLVNRQYVHVKYTCDRDGYPQAKGEFIAKYAQLARVEFRTDMQRYVPINKGKPFREMKRMDFKELYEKARDVARPIKLSEDAESGGVGAAILTDTGNVYVGVCIDTACSMGFCAEHAAAAAMVTAGEHIIKKVIAVGCEGNIMPPCGRCREFMSQLADENAEAEVMVDENTSVRLKELLPFDWRE